MDDILSQIIAYAPDKIDTEIKARALVQGSRNMKLAQVPRSEMDNFNTPDLDQGSDSILKPGETLEDDFDVTFRRPNAQGGRIPFGDGLSVDPERDSFKKISNVIGAYNRYRRGEKNPALNFNQFFELFATENFAEGGQAGQLVSNTVDGSRPGYSGDRKTVHLINETGNPNHSGIYKTTNTKTGSVSYRGGYTRRDEGGRQSTKSSSTIKGARELLNKALETPKGKSMIDLQAEKGAGNMLKDKKFMTQLEKAFEEVSALEKKGYGNIDKIVKKYETKFYKKVGTKNIDGSTVTKGTDNEFTKALRSEIREYAKDLDIYNVENPNMEKALNDYRKIKNPKKGMIGNIAERYGIKRGMLDSYITNLGQRKYIPIKDPDEYTKAIRAAEKKAIDKFSDSYFERKLSASKTTGVPFNEAKPNEIVRLQKSHMGDKLTQNVKTGNIGYAADEINQEVLKDFDTELRQINKDLEKLYKNKPKGYLQEMDKLNTRGMDLAAASKGYKKFEATDPKTGKKFVINYSSAAQELDPTNLLGDNVNLADVGKENKAAVKELKDMSIKNISKTKKQVAADIKEIASNLEKLGCGKAAGGRILFANGVPNLTKCGKAGVAKLEKGLANGFKGNDVGLAKKILGSGKFLKDAVSLRGLFGPAALAFTALTEAGFVASDAISDGKSFREAIGDSAFNYMLGDKTKINSEEEFIKRLKNIPGSPSQGFRGVTDEDIGKMQYFKESLKDMGVGFKNYNTIKDLEKKIEDNTLNQQVPEFPDQAFQLNTQLDKAQAENQDYFRTNTANRVSNYLMSDAASEGAEALQKSNLMAKQDQLNNAYRSSLKGIESLKKEKEDIRGDLYRINNPTEYNEFSKYFMSKPKQEQSMIMGLGYNEGGIASLNVKK